jgi:type I restriction enzyme S subunit
MTGEWRRHSVSTLIERGALIVGDGYRAKNDELASSGLPFARAGNINNGFQFDDADHFPECSLPRVGNKVSQPGDVVFTSKGTVGRVAFVRPDTPRFVYSPQLCFWRSVDKDLIDPRFLYFWMYSHEFFVQYKGVAGQTDMAEYVSLSDQRRMHITLPPLPEQRAIAHILGTLDDKIELNRRMSETLEQMARALFKAWFVDFEPVRAKMEGRWRRGESLPGLPAHLYDLFPDRLVDSELGEIPEGWRVGTVDEEFDLTMGQSPPGDTYNEIGDGVPFYQGSSDFGFRFPTRRMYCTVPTRLAKAGDTLVSVRAPVGDINMSLEECAIGRGVAAVRHKTGSRSYSYHFMWSIKSALARFEAEGTVFGSIGKKDFHAITCVKPPRDLVLAYEACVSSLDSRIEVNERQSRTLAALRDTLLPKLIRGEIRVKDAERFLEERGV